jgi:ABC-type polysaccharide/polyol phosphate transport system ATPase subunit
MSNIAIKVEDLSKIYRLGEIGTGTISRDMERWFKTKVLKQEDPFLKIGETNDRANKGASDIVYSLRDINFEIQQGDAVGIIGRNGAGKSTLLKIISRVTTPTTGKINIKGRVASLLEVGTGFHPELTGRENIFLNGAILGMRKREIDRKLDEIIDFSGVERYIDTPVKRYSSGMYVRLAFAVAAHLESEILIIDEVLAVGDAEFQKKCLGKMGDVSKGEGRTVLFVSHNMSAIQKLCNNSLLMTNGKIDLFSDTFSAVAKYNAVQSQKQSYTKKELSLFQSEIRELSINNEITNIEIGDEIEIGIKYFCSVNNQCLSLSIALYDGNSNYILNSPSSSTDKIWSGKPHKIGIYNARVVLPGSLLNNIKYQISVLLIENQSTVIEHLVDVLYFEVRDTHMHLGYVGYWGGVVRPELKWEIHDQKNS